MTQLTKYAASHIDGSDRESNIETYRSLLKVAGVTLEDQSDLLLKYAIRLSLNPFRNAKMNAVIGEKTLTSKMKEWLGKHAVTSNQKLKNAAKDIAKETEGAASTVATKGTEKATAKAIATEQAKANAVGKASENIVPKAATTTTEATKPEIVKEVIAPKKKLTKSDLAGGALGATVAGGAGYGLARVTEPEKKEDNFDAMRNMYDSAGNFLGDMFSPAQKAAAAYYDILKKREEG